MNIRQSLATFTARENLVTLAIAALLSAVNFLPVAFVRIHGDRELAFSNEASKNSNLVQAHAERVV